MRYKLVQSVGLVALFWWAVLTAYGLLSGAWRSVDELTWFVSENALWVGGGVVVGIMVSISAYLLLRVTTRRSIAGRGVRGLTSTLGPPPLPTYRLPMADTIPSVTGSVAVERWLATLKRMHPDHYDLAIHILRILWADPKMPASHVRGGHGGKTLWEHSLLVCEQAIAMAPAWSYKGLYTLKGELVTALRDTSYRFDPTDPLIGIVALAHDMGKLRTFLRDKVTGEVLKETHEHDKVSAFMLTKLDPFWKLPRQDQEAILGAVGYYHKPQSFPLDEGQRAYDDRTHALMELLIAADRSAGQLESNLTPVAVAESTDAAFLDRLWMAFCEIVTEAGRVNGTNKAQLIGQKKGEIAVLKEQELRQLLGKKLAVQSSAGITLQLLEVLFEKDVLYDPGSDLRISHRSRPRLNTYKVSFFSDSTGQHLASWNRCVVITPKHVLPHVSSLMDHPARFEVHPNVEADREARVAVDAPDEDARDATGTPSVVTESETNSTIVAVTDQSGDTVAPTLPEAAKETGDCLDDDVMIQLTESIEKEAEEKAEALVESQERDEVDARNFKLKKLSFKEKDKLARLESDMLLQALGAISGVATQQESVEEAVPLEEDVLLCKLAALRDQKVLEVLSEKDGRVWFAAAQIEPHLPSDWRSHVNGESGFFQIRISDEKLAAIGVRMQ